MYDDPRRGKVRKRCVCEKKKLKSDMLDAFNLLVYLEQCPSKFNAHINHLGILLKCRFWLGRSGMGPKINKIPGDPDPWTILDQGNLDLLILGLSVKELHVILGKLLMISSTWISSFFHGLFAYSHFWAPPQKKNERNLTWGNFKVLKDESQVVILIFKIFL